MYDPNNKTHYISNMEVIKRNGNKEKVSFDKIIARIEAICEKLKLTRINVIEIAKQTIQGLYDGIHTEELDFLAAQKCAENIMDDPQYDKLAAGLCVSNLHKTTSNDFMEVTDKLYNYIGIKGNKVPLISDEYYDNVIKNKDLINSIIDYDRDYYFDFFGIKTLEKSYLVRIKYNPDDVSNNKSNTNRDENKEVKIMRNIGRVIERPQHLFMRVAIGIHGSDMGNVIKTYNYMSNQYFIHASPTLYNAGMTRPQLSSCFLMGMDDNIESIFKTMTDAAYISKWSGGIGIHISDIRSKGSLINGTNGLSDGWVPLIRHVNTLVQYINQGGKRNGAIALYGEPWHSDIFEFCELKKANGKEELRARDIFLALWIPDLFMKRVENNEMWSLMCPFECPNLSNVYGDEFEKLYTKYENEGKYMKRVKASELWFHILECQIETGVPYMLYKDACNEKSNQKNYGVIKSSNLCAEIIEYSDTKEYAVCNLASICLPRFVEYDDLGKKYVFNFDKLIEVSGICTENLNKIIDINYYPVPETKISNLKHRPIGIGVQGLSDVFYKMDIPFDSDEAYKLNKQIFETIYFGAITKSIELAKIYGPYETFKGSPFSQGKLQFHLWGISEDDLLMNYDWKTVINDIMKYGIRNSLLTSIMPTASTSQIMSNTECIEPKTTNLYTRSTLAGEYIVVNTYLVEKLITCGLWNKEVKDEFLFDNGSIQNIDSIPYDIKNVFKTAFEIKTKPILNMAIGRGPFIDQSQSTNIFSKSPDFDMLTSSHFYGWENGLKTGMYYLRSVAAVDPVKFGLDPEVNKKIREKRGLENITYDESKKNTNINNCDVCSA